MGLEAGELHVAVLGTSVGFLCGLSAFCEGGGVFAAEAGLEGAREAEGVLVELGWKGGEGGVLELEGGGLLGDLVGGEFGEARHFGFEALYPAVELPHFAFAGARALLLWGA